MTQSASYTRATLFDLLISALRLLEERMATYWTCAAVRKKILLLAGIITTLFQDLLGNLIFEVMAVVVMWTLMGVVRLFEIFQSRVLPIT